MKSCPLNFLLPSAEAEGEDAPRIQTTPYDRAQASDSRTGTHPLSMLVEVEDLSQELSRNHPAAGVRKACNVSG